MPKSSPSKEARLMKKRIDHTMSPENMSVEDAYRFASDLYEHLETTIDGLRCDLEGKGIDPDELG